jgi:hypothetical protein
MFIQFLYLKGLWCLTPLSRIFQLLTYKLVLESHVILDTCIDITITSNYDQNNNVYFLKVTWGFSHK